ncbi:MAG: hypothetical protein HOP28_13535 [Gemmatimonadales bacterium]|nr:hypothetical protein [Gemmatimonadales bacterium]
MVGRVAGSRRGTSTLGCLFTIMILLTVLYYGLEVGRVYWKFYRMQDEMETSARFAQSTTDDQIVKHLVGIAQDLELPAAAQRFTIRRTERPNKVIIKSRYTVEIELPFTRKILTLTPTAEVRQ